MSIKVVIVEDDSDIQKGFKSLLESKENIECIGAFGSAEAFMKDFDFLKPDVVLMDIQLPRMSGIDCIKQIRQSVTKTQFLICSIYENDDNIFNALCAGAVGYLLKNTSGEKLIESIKEVYSGGSPMSMEIARKVVNVFKKNQDNLINQTNINLLTPREKEILDLLSKGYRYKEIADTLFISIQTVRPHIRNIYGKLEVGSRMDAVNKIYPKR